MIKQIGKHRVRHGDVFSPELDAYVGGIKANIFYSDPPWGTGNLKYWETMNKKMNPGTTTHATEFQVDPFLNRIFDLAVAHTDGWVAIEYGQRWTEKVVQFGESHGLHYCGQVEGLYGSGSGSTEYNNKYPYDLVVFHTAGKRPIDLSSLHHLTAYGFVKEAFRLLKPETGGIGMDLCCGMGYTAQACIDNDLSFVGNELNKKRLGLTIKRLEKAQKKLEAAK